MTAAPALVSLATLWLCMCATGQASAQGRAKAEVSCRPAGAELEYDCVIRLTDAHGKAPVAGATITVGADMPSMPMAHNIRPVKAAPGGEPGLYEVRLELEMHGVWALRIDVSRPLRDRVVVPLQFDENAVRPPGPSPRRTR
jgi:YtkA-like